MPNYNYMQSGLGEGSQAGETMAAQATPAAQTAAKGAAATANPYAAAATAALDAYQKARERKDKLHAGKVSGVLGGIAMASDTIKAMPTFNPISASRF